MKKIILIIFSFSLLASCNKKESNTEIDEKNSMSQGKDVQIIKNEFIISITDSFANELKTRIDQLSPKGFKYYQDARKNIYFNEFLANNTQYNKFKILSTTSVNFTIDADSSIMSLKSNPKVLNIRNNYLQKFEIPIDTVKSGKVPTAEVQWNIQMVWNSSHNNLSSNKTAWIIDTGIEPDHEDLNVDKGKSISFVASEPNINDENGHGTHVAGIIGAKANGKGVIGVAPNAKIVAVKVLNKNNIGSLRDFMSGLEYVKENGQSGDIVNLSLGCDDPTCNEVPDVTRLISLITQKGIYVVIASGNKNQNLDVVKLYPANYFGNNIFVVAGCSQDLKWYGNHGSNVKFFAPGVNIYSTYKNPQKYKYLTGTSMAAPHVSGLLYLIGIVNNGLSIIDPNGRTMYLSHE